MTHPRRVVVAIGEPRPHLPPRAVVTVDGRTRPDAVVAVAPSGALVVTVPAKAPDLIPTREGDPVTRCTTCSTEWTGLAECHCATCHRHFGSLDAFDRHRVGPVDTRDCADPETMVRKDGKPIFKPTDRKSGTTWVVDKPARVFPVAELESEPRNDAGGTWMLPEPAETG